MEAKVRLKRWRINRGLSMAQLSEITGISTRTMVRIERYGAMPHPSTLLKLAEALHITVDDLLVEEDTLAKKAS